MLLSKLPQILLYYRLDFLEGPFLQLFVEGIYEIDSEGDMELDSVQGSESFEHDQELLPIELRSPCIGHDHFVMRYHVPLRVLFFIGEDFGNREIEVDHNLCQWTSLGLVEKEQ